MTCLESVAAVLAEAGRASHPSGVAALAIARRIDAGPESSAGLAALAKQLQSSLDVALARVEVEADPLDELKARREQRRSS